MSIPQQYLIPSMFLKIILNISFHICFLHNHHFYPSLFEFYISRLLNQPPLLESDPDLTISLPHITFLFIFYHKENLKSSSSPTYFRLHFPSNDLSSLALNPELYCSHFLKFSIKNEISLCTQISFYLIYSSKKYIFYISYPSSLPLPSVI